MRYVKDKVNTVSKWGDFPHQRSIEDLIPRSVMIIDKPKGPTSHQVSSWVQRMFSSKAGHSGTLDPNATGVLPMGIGYSVRMMDLLHVAPKEYVASMRFHSTVKKTGVEEVLEKFEGDIYQMPPVRSGVKRKVRTRTIYELELLDFRGKDCLLRVRCQSGTYVRTLCKDIGKALGVGGNMEELRRTEAGGFTEKESHILQRVKDALVYYEDGEEGYLREILKPHEEVFGLYPSVKVKDTAAGSILNGADLAAPGLVEFDKFSSGDRVGVASVKGEILALGVALYPAEKMMEMDEGLVVRTERVFHPSGEYPGNREENIY